jgi:hypothetical protein
MEVVPASVGEASRRWDDEHLDLQSAADGIAGAPTSGFTPAVTGTAVRFTSAWSQLAADAGRECEARADDYDLLGGGFDLAEVHLLLGLTVLALGVVRPLWRRVAGLPPWSEHLSDGQRRLVHWTERALLALLVLVPFSGIVLVATGDDAWLPLHVAAHVAFFVALAAHLSTNLRPVILRRML